MVPTYDDKHYTLLFTCNFSTTIPCHPASEDVGKICNIDKPCPQCLPHPYLINVIFDQAHWDEVQAQKKSQEFVEAATSKGGSQGQDRLSRFLTVSDDKRSVSVGSLINESSIKSSLRARLHKLKQVVKRDKKSTTQAEEAFAHAAKERSSTGRVEKLSVRDTKDALSTERIEKVSVQAAVEAPCNEMISAPLRSMTRLPEPGSKENQEDLGRLAWEKAENIKREVEKELQDAEWESFLEKAKALQKRLERDIDNEAKRKDIEQRLAEAEREVALAKALAIEKSLMQLS